MRCYVILSGTRVPAQRVVARIWFGSSNADPSASTPQDDKSENVMGFVIFIAVLAVIWTLSAIATAVNKQKDAERRRMLRDQMARAGIRTPEPVPQPPQRRPVQRPQAISRGIAERFPDVLLPPAPMKPRPQAQRRPQPIRHP